MPRARRLSTRASVREGIRWEAGKEGESKREAGSWGNGVSIFPFFYVALSQRRSMRTRRYSARYTSATSSNNRIEFDRITFDVDLIVTMFDRFVSTDVKSSKSFKITIRVCS